MPKKILKGQVTSTKMDKTIVVSVSEKNPHARYQKFVSKTKKFKAHDEENKCKLGDVVEIIENRKISKTKAWILNKILTSVEK